MAEAYIIDAVRTPVGRRNGGLSKVHPADLGAHTIKAMMRTHWDRPVWRSTTSCSAASTRSARRPVTSPARRGWRQGCRKKIPGVTIDRQCGSAQQAIRSPRSR